MIAVITLLALGAYPSPQDSPRAVLAGLVAALNTKNADKLREFVVSHTDPGARVSAMVRQWGETANDLVPFKIVGDGKEANGEVDAFLEDKDGSRLVFELRLTQTGKLMGLLIVPAFTVEGPNPELAGWTSLSGLAQTIAAKDHIPAMGIAVIRNGRLEVAVSGVRRLGAPSKAETDDVWSIGSIGKSICSSVVGKLIELGKLRWDETLAEALPGTTMNPGYRSVTLEQVMHHRGGIPRDSTMTDEEVERIAGGAKTPADQRWRYIRYVLLRAPISKPGAEFHYSNAGYSLLAVVAERAAGKPYEELVHEFVFQPLGLKHSYTDVDPLPETRPSGHVENEGRSTPEDVLGPIKAMLSGAGVGLWMSLGDLATYGAAHMAGLQGKDGFLKATTIARLHAGVPQYPGGLPYACGWGRLSVPGLQEWDGHNGSDGTMRSELAIFPAANLVVVGITNSGGEQDPSPGFEAVMAVAQRFAPAK